MAKDYAKRAQKKPAPRRRGIHARSESNSGLWLLALLLVALFVGGLTYLKRHAAELTVAKQTTAEATKLSATSNTKPPEAFPKTPATPRFDFYTVLPKSKVTADSPKPATQAPASKSAYILQLGVFDTYAAADELKARMMLLGIETNISSFSKDNSTFYRVWLGPYKTKAEAQQQQHTLQANQLKGQITKQA